MSLPEDILKEIGQLGNEYEEYLVRGLAGTAEKSRRLGANKAGVPNPSSGKAKRINYRKLAFAHYEQFGQIVCAHCGFGIRDVLEVAHLDCDRSNNDPANLAILCPNCHKMHDLDLISTETIIIMRDRPKVVVWAKRMKDAGAKAADTRRKTAERLKWKSAGLKAAETRKRNTAEAKAK